MVEQALQALIPFDQMSLVVEVGSGRGALARRLAATLEGSGKVIGFDIDGGSIRLAEREAAAEHIRNVEFQMGDVYDLPIAEESADLVVCCSLLCGLTRARDAVREMKRLVRKGGFLAAAEPVSRQLAHDPGDSRFTNLSEKLSRAFQRGWNTRKTDQSIGLKVPGFFLEHGLEAVSAEVVCPVHLLCDPRRGFREIVDQLKAESSSLPGETTAMLAKGGISRQELREHHLRAEKRFSWFSSDPAAVANSGYVRMMAPLMVTVGIKPSAA